MKKIGRSTHIKRPKKSLKGLLAALLIAAAPSKSRKPADTDLLKGDFSTNSRKLGIRFTDRIRDAFRHRWLKKR